MRLVVVSYPELNEGDLRRIGAWRAQFPEMDYSVVAPHFTLVFPLEGVGADALIAHIQSQAQQVAPFEISLRCALVVDDVTTSLTHVFLVPDEGFSAVVRLHDRFYTSILAPHLRLDVPFIPHVTVGYSTRPLLCKQVADAINAEEFTFTGWVRMLDILAVDPADMREIARVPLGRPMSDG